MERTQLMLYELSNFFATKELPEIPVYLDSPLAINVTQVYEKWGSEYFKPHAKQELKLETQSFRIPLPSPDEDHVRNQKQYAKYKAPRS
jgi:metallo-beta-lactamase family protein